MGNHPREDENMTGKQSGGKLRQGLEQALTAAKPQAISQMGHKDQVTLAEYMQVCLKF